MHGFLKIIRPFSPSLRRLQQNLIRIHKPQLFFGHFLRILFGLDVNLVFLQLGGPLFFLFLLLLQVLFADAVFQVRFLKVGALYIDCHSQKHDYQGNTHDGHAVGPFVTPYAS